MSINDFRPGDVVEILGSFDAQDWDDEEVTVPKNQRVTVGDTIDGIVELLGVKVVADGSVREETVPLNEDALSLLSGKLAVAEKFLDPYSAGDKLNVVRSFDSYKVGEKLDITEVNHKQWDHRYLIDDDIYYSLDELNGNVEVAA